MSDLLPSPQTELAAIKRGDTWRGLGSVTIATQGGAFNLTGATVKMHLRKRAQHGAITAAWSTTEGTILLTDATAGKLKVLGRKMDVPAGVYAWDIEVGLPASAEWPDGRVLTIAQGTWKILQDVSR